MKPTKLKPKTPPAKNATKGVIIFGTNASAVNGLNHKEYHKAIVLKNAVIYTEKREAKKGSTIHKHKEQK